MAATAILLLDKLTQLILKSHFFRSPVIMTGFLFKKITIFFTFLVRNHLFYPHILT